jgi:hypothetical protein
MPNPAPEFLGLTGRPCNRQLEPRPRRGAGDRNIFLVRFPMHARARARQTVRENGRDLPCSANLESRKRAQSLAVSREKGRELHIRQWQAFRASLGIHIRSIERANFHKSHNTRRCRASCTSDLRDRLPLPSRSAAIVRDNVR